MSEEESDQERNLQTAAEIALVELRPGIAALYSKDSVAGLETMSFDLLNNETNARLADGLSMLLNAGSIGSQFVQTGAVLQGLVQLTPKTLKDLETMAPMTNGLVNYGSLMKGSSIGASLQWTALPPETAALLTGPGMLPTLALAGVANQVATINRKLDENLELTRQAINEIRQATQEDRWATLISLDKVVSKALDEARSVGQVTGHIFGPIQGKESEIIKSRELFSNNVQKHLSALSANIDEQRSYIEANEQAILNDANGLLLAEWTRHRWNVLRSAHISLDESAYDLLETVLATTENEYEESRKKLENLLSTLVQQLNLIKELTPEGGLARIPFGKGRRSLNSADKAESLAQAVSALAGKAYRTPAQPEPNFTVFNQEVEESLYRILRWALPPGTRLLAFADVNEGFTNSYLGITETDFFIVSYGDLRKKGLVGELHPLADIRYVRLDERKSRDPQLHIITKDQNFQVDFDRWITSGENLFQARRLADILATVMNLPVDEKKNDPIFELEGQKKLSGGSK